MSISDIQLCKNEIHIVKSFTMTSEFIEDTISQYKYSGQKGILDTEVENAKLPPFCKHFYKYIFIHNKIPDQDEFSNTYIEQNKKICEQYNQDALKSRILRAYPSFIRDFHFYVLLEESGLFENVRYSYKTDVEDGIDIMVTYKEQLFGISLMCDTNRSNDFKKSKQNRHNYKNINEVIVRLNFNNCRKAGCFYVYTQRHVDMVMFGIKKFIGNN